jgi:hypothetical protein
MQPSIIFTALTFISAVFSAPVIDTSAFDYSYGSADVSVVQTARLSGCNLYYCDPSFSVKLAVRNKSFKKVG